MSNHHHKGAVTTMELHYDSITDLVTGEQRTVYWMGLTDNIRQSSRLLDGVVWSEDGSLVHIVDTEDDIN